MLRSSRATDFYRTLKTNERVFSILVLVVNLARRLSGAFRSSGAAPLSIYPSIISSRRLNRHVTYDRTRLAIRMENRIIGDVRARIGGPSRSPCESKTAEISARRRVERPSEIRARRAPRLSRRRPAPDTPQHAPVPRAASSRVPCNSSLEPRARLKVCRRRFDDVTVRISRRR